MEAAGPDEGWPVSNARAGVAAIIGGVEFGRSVSSQALDSNTVAELHRPGAKIRNVSASGARTTMVVAVEI